jgi:hypothetical protein
MKIVNFTAGVTTTNVKDVTIGVIDMGGNFAASVNDTCSSFAADLLVTGGAP